MYMHENFLGKTAAHLLEPCHNHQFKLLTTYKVISLEKTQKLQIDKEVAESLRERRNKTK